MRFFGKIRHFLRSKIGYVFDRIAKFSGMFGQILHDCNQAKPLVRIILFTVLANAADGISSNALAIDLSVENAGAVNEPDAGEPDADMVFTVILSEPAPKGGVTFSWRTINYTKAPWDIATYDKDYVSVRRNIETIAEGQSSTTLTVKIIGDNIQEEDEQVHIGFYWISTIGKTVMIDDSAYGVITDNKTIFLNVEDAVAVKEPNYGEPDADMIFMVTLSQPAPTGGVTFNWRTYGSSWAGYISNYGTAREYKDFVGTYWTIASIAEGKIFTTLTIKIKGDNIPEFNENVVVSVSNLKAKGRKIIINDDSASGVITDNGGRKTIVVSLADADAVEEPNFGSPDANMVFTVTLSEPAPAGGLTFGWWTSGGTATPDMDYVWVNGAVVTIAEGRGSTTLTVKVKGDNVFEFNETVTASVYGGTATGRKVIINDDSASGVITNNNNRIRNHNTITLSVADAEAVEEPDAGEPDADMIFTVTLSEPAPVGGVTFSWKTSIGYRRALPGIDFVQVFNASAKIPEGRSSTQLIVKVKGDDIPEVIEDVIVNISGAKATGKTVVIKRYRAEGLITDNENRIVLSVADAEGVEEPNFGSPDANMVFTVTLSEPAPAGGVTFSWRTYCGCYGPDKATKDEDYLGVDNAIAKIAEGRSSTTLRVKVKGDDKKEKDETIYGEISWSSAIGGTVVIAQPYFLGVIIDNKEYSISDAPIVMSVMALTAVVEPDTGEPDADMVFTVTLNEPAPAGGVTFSWKSCIKGYDLDYLRQTSKFRPKCYNYGSANSNDYIMIENANATITEGRNSTTLTVKVKGDDVPEPHETVYVYVFNKKAIGRKVSTERTKRLINPFSNSFVTYFTGTIIDNDRIGLSVMALTEVVEPDMGEPDADMVFKVTLSQPAPAGGLTFSWSTGGTAMEDEDYVEVDGANATIAEGRSSTTLTVKIKGDDIPEPDETVVIQVTVSKVFTGYVRGNSRTETRFYGVGRIVDNDGYVIYYMIVTEDESTVEEPDLGEPDADMVFTVTLSRPAPAGGVTFNWETSGDTATEGEDYVGVDGARATIPEGRSSTTLTVKVKGDDKIEDDETVKVRISDGNVDGGRVVIGNYVPFSVITDNDVALSILDAATVYEPDSGDPDTYMVFTVSLGKPAPVGGVTFKWSTGEDTATAEKDYVSVNGAIAIITEGMSSTKLTVKIKGDDDPEYWETVTVRIFDGKITATGKMVIIKKIMAEGDIYDDYIELSVEIVDAVNEPDTDDPDTDMLFMVTLSRSAPAGGVAFNWSTANGTATAGMDYMPVSNRFVTIASGQRSAVLKVKVKGDDYPEVDETIKVRVFGGTAGWEYNLANVVIIKSMAEGLITNDDEGIGLSVLNATEVDEPSAGKPDTNMVFTVTLSKPALAGGVSFNWSTSGGTATAGSDYIHIRNTTAIITEGRISTTLTVKIKEDDDPEDDETVRVTVSKAAAAGETVVITRITAEGVINDNSLYMRVANAEAVEDADADMVFPVTLSKPAPAGGVMFIWSTSGGSASADIDYASVLNRSVTIAEGGNSTMLTVKIKGRGDPEVDKTVLVTVSAAMANGEAVPITKTTAQGLISVEIEVVSITAGNVAGNGATIKTGEAAIFTIKSTFSSSTEVGISVTQNGDYIFQSIASTITFEDSKSFELVIPTANYRKTIQKNGSITVTLLPDSNQNGYAVATKNKAATVNINSAETGDTEMRYSVASSVIRSILLSIPETPASAHTEIHPVISIASETMLIEEGSDAVFILTASRAVNSSITANIELTQTGNFLKDATRTTAKIEHGHVNASLSVATANDDIAEEDGSVQALITEGDGYVIGSVNQATVTISDVRDRNERRILLTEANQTALSQMAVSIGSKSMDMATHRIGQAFTEFGGMSFEIGENSTMTESLYTLVSSMDKGMQAWQDILGDSSLEIGLFPEENEVSPATIWGLSDYKSLGNSESLGGDVFTGHLGFDAHVADGIVTGLSSSLSQFDMNYKSGDSSVTYQISSTGVHPYFGFEFSGGNRFHLIAGYGLNEIKLDQYGYDQEFLDGSFLNFGSGGEIKMYSSENLLAGGTSDLSISSEFWQVSQFVRGRSDIVSNMRSDGHHLKLSLAGFHEHELEHGATISPSISLGLREDRMIQQSSFGMEIEGDLNYSNNFGYWIISNGRILLSDIRRIHEWEVSGLLSYDSFGDDLGVLLDITPAWGQNLSDKDKTLWDQNIPYRDFDSETHSDGLKFDAEIGYGIEIWNEVNILTPYGRLGLGQNEDSKFNLGGKLNIGSNIQFELNNFRTYQGDGHTENEIGFESSIKW